MVIMQKYYTLIFFLLVIKYVSPTFCSSKQWYRDFETFLRSFFGGFWCSNKLASRKVTQFQWCVGKPTSPSPRICSKRQTRRQDSYHIGDSSSSVLHQRRNVSISDFPHINLNLVWNAADYQDSDLTRWSERHNSPVLLLWNCNRLQY